MKYNRIFVAIDLPEEIKQKIESCIEPLKLMHDLRSVKWSKTEKLHLTLCFLGTITAEQYLNFSEKVKQVVTLSEPFNLEFIALEPFPAASKFRIISLRPELTTTLIALANLINIAATESGISTENRPFKPHLTLGRIIDDKNIDAKILTKIKLAPMCFKVKEIKIFNSEPSPNGAAYTELLSCHLLPSCM